MGTRSKEIGLSFRFIKGACTSFCAFFNVSFKVKEDEFFDRFLYNHLISMVEQVDGYQEYGFDRTIYTIVLLTSNLHDGKIKFSYAVSNMNPRGEYGDTVEVYPHRLVFLCPRKVNDKTPPLVKKWLNFIKDSLDGEMDEKDYPEALWRKIMAAIQKRTISPTLLSEIKDDVAWEKAKIRFVEEGRKEGVLKQQRETILQAREMGLDEMAIAKLTGLSTQAIKNIMK
ncbi:MAG: hypothetical protein ABFS56_12710 [Pseudomonadota bacterium]